MYTLFIQVDYLALYVFRLNCFRFVFTAVNVQHNIKCSETFLRQKVKIEEDEFKEKNSVQKLKIKPTKKKKFGSFVCLGRDTFIYSFSRMNIPNFHFSNPAKISSILNSNTVNTQPKYGNC